MQARGRLTQPTDQRGKAAVIIIEDLVALGLTQEKHGIEAMLGDAAPRNPCIPPSEPVHG